MDQKTLFDIKVSKWVSPHGFSMDRLRGKIVLVHAFQMLCPACVLHGTPQASKMYDLFNPNEVAVIGLHTVFEHHEGMREPSLRAFLHEFGVEFPVGIDEPSADGGVPRTMSEFSLQGTPSWLIFDRKGALRFHSFGRTEELVMGAEIARLAAEGISEPPKLFNRN